MAGGPDPYQEILMEIKELRRVVGFASKRLFTVEETAHYCGLSSKTIRNGLGPRAKKPFPIKSVKMVGRVLFRKEDLDLFIDAMAGS